MYVLRHGDFLIALRASVQSECTRAPIRDESAKAEGGWKAGGVTDSLALFTVKGRTRAGADRGGDESDGGGYPSNSTRKSCGNAWLSNIDAAAGGRCGGQEFMTNGNTGLEGGCGVVSLYFIFRPRSNIGFTNYVATHHFFVLA